MYVLHNDIMRNGFSNVIKARQHRRGRTAPQVFNTMDWQTCKCIHGCLTRFAPQISLVVEAVCLHIQSNQELDYADAQRGHRLSERLDQAPTMGTNTHVLVTPFLFCLSNGELEPTIVSFIDQQLNR